MAKWGEGDPRWIVEERPDATNVNNWHWTEKNADNWSKQKLRSLLEALVIEDPKIGNVAVDKVDKVEGEARVNNRKAKLIFFYEWEIKFTWKGHVNGKDKEVTGTVEIPNLSEEHEDIEDVDVDVALSGSKGPEADVLKEMMRKGAGAKAVRKVLQSYVDSLKTEFCQVTGVILPGKDEKSPGGVAKTTKQTKVTSGSTIINKLSSSDLKGLDIGGGAAAVGTKIDTTTFELKEHFKCTGQELYNALTQKEMLQIFTGKEVKMEKASKGESFEMIDGIVQGSWLEVEPFTKICQKWRLRSWPPGHFARVEIAIKQGKEDTTLQLKCQDVPLQQVESTKEGWRNYYFNAIKRVFGFGSSLF